LTEELSPQEQERRARETRKRLENHDKLFGYAYVRTKPRATAGDDAGNSVGGDD
jgi:hypothetical protein